MSRKIIVAVFLFITITSCNSGKDAFQYSEDVVEIERSMGSTIQETEALYSQYLTDAKYDSAMAVSNRMMKFVDGKIDELQRLKKPRAKEVDQFREAALNFFQYMRELYSTYAEYAKNATGDHVLEYQQKLEKMVNKKNNIIDAMQQAQLKYAKANGFRIEPGK